MMPTLVMAGSARTQATSLCFSADSRALRSLNSTTRVVSAGFTGGWIFVLRGGARGFLVRGGGEETSTPRAELKLERRIFAGCVLLSGRHKWKKSGAH